jgi:hypothetical protein
MRGGLTVPSRSELVVEVKLDLRPFAEACRQVAAQFEALAATFARVGETRLPGLQKLATASDLTIASRRGEVACAGVHDALPPGGCHFCGAAL